MIGSYGGMSTYGEYGLFGSKKRKAEQEAALSQINFQLPDDYQLVWEDAAPRYVPVDQAPRHGRAAEDIAAVTTGVGTLAQGISSLIWGGRQAPQYAPVGEEPPAQPGSTPTGPILLGVGAIMMMGMLGVAMMSGSGGGRRRRLS